MIETAADLPRLSLTGQTSLSTDRYSDNGVEKNLHYVIKNNTYSVELALPAKVRPSFSSLSVEAEILYDSMPVPKDVFQVKAQPFWYKGLVCKSDSRRLTMEFRVSVLSSQHEDMNFLVHFVVRSSQKGEVAGKVVAEGFSEPMQCISKPDVLRKKRGTKTKKRTWNDRVTEALEQLTEMQQETMKLVRMGGGQEAKSGKEAVSADAATRFEEGFRTMVQAYEELAADERPHKIRKIVSSSTTATQTTFAEMADQFFAEGLAVAGGKLSQQRNNDVLPLLLSDINGSAPRQTVMDSILQDFGWSLPDEAL